MVANYSTSNTLGINLDATFTPGTTLYPYAPSLPGLQAGQTVLGQNGSRYVWCLASSAITQYQAVSIDENFGIAALTKALADTLKPVGFSQVAIASGSYGWVCVQGENISVLCRANTTKLTALYTTTSAGVVGSTSTSQTLIAGLILTTSGSTTSKTAKAAIATYPRAVT